MRIPMFDKKITSTSFFSLPFIWLQYTFTPTTLRRYQSTSMIANRKNECNQITIWNQHSHAYYKQESFMFQTRIKRKKQSFFFFHFILTKHTRRVIVALMSRVLMRSTVSPKWINFGSSISERYFFLFLFFLQCTR